MPELGEVRTAKELGLPGANRRVYRVCVVCGEGGYARMRHGQPKSLMCIKCVNVGRTQSEETKRKRRETMKRMRPSRATEFKKGENLGENSWNWKGEQYMSQGYVYVWQLGHHRAKCGRVLRSVLVLEEKLGRPIKDGYVVHHHNDVRDDDRPENLFELTPSEHARLHVKRVWAYWHGTTKEEIFDSYLGYPQHIREQL